MLLLIVVLLFIIALPNILNILATALGLTWLYSFISKYGKYILVSCIAIAIIILFLYIYKNKEKIKWNYFKRKTEQISHKIIKKEFNNNPAVTSRHVFDEIIKVWVPLVKKMYPNSTPKELGIKLGITPKGIQEKMDCTVLNEKERV